MRALWSGCQDSVVLSNTQLSVIRGICLLEGRGAQSSAWSTAPLQTGPLCSPHQFHPINPLCICFPPSLSSSVPVSTFTQMYQCPYCKFTNTDLNRLRMHVMTQHSVQPMLRCPLCQDMLNNKIHLQFHLTHLHSVAPDCVDKLIATVSPALGTGWVGIDEVLTPFNICYFSVINAFGFFSLPTCIFEGNLKLACVLLDWYVAIFQNYSKYHA